LTRVKKADAPATCPAAMPDCQYVQPSEVNPNFGRVTAYQPPRIFRFGLRVTF
jgi:hypothetical protein